MWFSDNAVHPRANQLINGLPWTDDGKTFVLHARLNPKPTPDYLRQEVELPVRAREREETIRRVTAEWQGPLQQLEDEKDREIQSLSEDVSVLKSNGHEVETAKQLVNDFTERHEKEVAGCRETFELALESNPLENEVKLTELRLKNDTECKNKLKRERRNWNNERAELTKKIKELEKKLSQLQS